MQAHFKNGLKERRIRLYNVNAQDASSLKSQGLELLPYEKQPNLYLPDLDPSLKLNQDLDSSYDSQWKLSNRFLDTSL